MPKPGEFNNYYPILLEQENQIKLLEDFKGAKQHHLMLCVICNHKWTATPLSKRQTLKKHGVSGCPNCNEIRKRTHYSKQNESVLQNLATRQIEIISEYTGLHTTTTKLKFKNHKCGHTFETYPGNIIHRNTECIVCGIKNRTDAVNKLSKERSAIWKETASDWKLYKSEVSKLTRECYKQNKKKINPKNLPRGKAGVEGAYHLDHKVPIRFCFDNNIPAEVCSHVDNLQMIGWLENVGSRNHIKGTIPYCFLPYINSEDCIQYYIDIIKREIGAGYDEYIDVDGTLLTLYNKEANVGVLIIPINKSFANQKTGYVAYKKLACTMRLFIIFEDELNTNLKLVCNKLKYYTNLVSPTRIHARKCHITTISPDTKRDFLNKNHIQGNDNSFINYGAYYEDRLVAVMTMSKPRVALGQKNKNRAQYEGKWELSRFSTDISIRIPGIASKLLTHFQRNHTWTEIYSYADKRWSVGNLYEVLGFELTANNPPDYFYIIDNQRKHRWNYRKDILKTKFDNYDSALTEYQNMVNNDFWRVWDCGTLKYTLKTSPLTDG